MIGHEFKTGWSMIYAEKRCDFLKFFLFIIRLIQHRFLFYLNLLFSVDFWSRNGVKPI